MDAEQRFAPVTAEDEQAGTAPAPLIRLQQRLLIANDAISLSQPDRDDFLHTVMCQVGLPRSRTDAKSSSGTTAT